MNAWTRTSATLGPKAKLWWHLRRRDVSDPRCAGKGETRAPHKHEELPTSAARECRTNGIEAPILIAVADARVPENLRLLHVIRLVQSKVS